MAVEVTCGPQPTLLSLLSQLTNYYCALIGTELCTLLQVAHAQKHYFSNIAVSSYSLPALGFPSK